MLISPRCFRLASCRARPGPRLAPAVALLAASLLALSLAGLLGAGCRPAESARPFGERPAEARRAPLPPRAADGLLRRPALQRVVEMQAARDADALADVLADSSADARVLARAAFAAASVQAPGLYAPLRARLHHPDARVRADAAFALGQLLLPKEDEVPSDTARADRARVLLRRLDDEADASVQAVLLDALGKQGDRASLDALLGRSLPDTLDAALALAVGRYGLRNVTTPEGVRRVTMLLSDPRPGVRLAAAYYVGRLDPERAGWAAAADTVRARFDALAPDDPAAMPLARGLGRLGDSTDTDRLARGLRAAPLASARAGFAQSLGGVPGPRATLALLDALDDDVPQVRAAAASALAGRTWTAPVRRAVTRWIDARPGEAFAAPALLRGLARQTDVAATDSASAFVQRAVRVAPDARARAARLPALALLDDDASRDALFAAARDSSTHVAAAALRALSSRWERERTEDAIPRYADAFADGLRRRDLATMIASARPLADSLFRPRNVRVLRHTYARLATPADVEAMVALLGALGDAARPEDAEAVALLQREARHPHPVVRRAAARAQANATDAEVPPATPALAPPLDAKAMLDWAYLAALGPHPRLVLEVAYGNGQRGRVVLRLSAEEAPQTTQTIARFAEAGRYDGVPFHRVVPAFVAQGGDVARGDGYGGPSFSIRSEFTRIPYRRGALGMASAGKDTEGSQFFVAHTMQPHLDGRYTAFGVAVEGMDVIDRLAPGDRIVAATVARDHRRHQ